jgi:uncharacterized MAPEG superfamily protein
MILAFWLVLAAAILPLVAIAPAKMRRDYDNSDPRKQYEALEGLPRRAVAAHLNSLEAFPFFAAGVAIAYLAATPAMVINLIAFVFILARIVYIAAYWTDRSTMRSTVWAVGWFACVALFVAPVLT